MTSRGPKPPIFLPPPDPTLQTRPVPRERHFAVRSFGPGSLPVTQQNFLSIDELKKLSVDASASRKKWGNVPEDLYKLLMSESNMSRMDWREDGLVTGEPTWGPVIVVTAYSEKASENLDQAITNLVETIHRYFLRYPDATSYASEAFKRLELKVLADKDLLEYASDDRVREEFNAYVRTLGLFPADLRWEKQAQKWFKDNLNRPSGPQRYGFCIVLDEETIGSLAGITFSDDLDRDKKLFKGIFLKFVDRDWRYPKEGDNKYGLDPTVAEVYKGIDMCPLFDLPLICAEYYSFAGLDEMFPLRDYWNFH
ncbi:hypothetical protein FVEN_g2089 [Fusarium venenatum]|uniref:Uncharacterized protein n=1 Tax=Fusarium venenatum TaxID=56646 RepID=A0A2L2T3J4_9HYPO|nr:uncharacterized protein FVRRES_12500 [Fusarium venenatum]KAG8360138.1 hypothetical protein FVEN_g2089 [Fusarium venenatum]KAH6979112.1 hypothetical protein EDB82DRAFT_558708 [Fusarium venenatum]CEI39809.1 unnamed protein product [Fusarium venenatum]